MEAFALAMVLFSSGMKSAMIVGIALIFGDVLQAVLEESCSQEYRYTMKAVGAALTAGVMYLMHLAIGVTPENKALAGFMILGILLMKHQEDRSRQGEEADYNAILLADAIAYAAYVVAAIAREYLTGSAIYEIALPGSSLASRAFGKPMFALIFAALFIAILNRILKAESRENAALWVCLPVILLEIPFVWNNVPELLGSIVGVLMVGVIYLTFRKKFLLTDPQKHIAGIPVETAALGMIYMIVSLL